MSRFRTTSSLIVLLSVMGSGAFAASAPARVPVTSKPSIRGGTALPPPHATPSMVGNAPNCVTTMSLNFPQLPVMREPVVGGGGGGTGDGTDGGIASKQEILQDALQDQIDDSQPTNTPNPGNGPKSGSASSGSGSTKTGSGSTKTECAPRY